MNLSTEKAGRTSVEKEVAFWGCQQEKFESQAAVYAMRQN